MAEPPTPVTRAQLYELVWSKPIAELERTHGFADGSLAKLCARHRVPTPPRGYWTQVRAGETPSRARLPRSTDEAPITLPNVHDRSDEQSDAETDRIIVPDRLSEPVAVVAQAREAMRDAQDEDNGMVKRPKGVMQLTVSRKALGLALRVADALFKACEQRGWPVEVREDHTIAVVAGVEIAISIAETMDRVEAPPEPAKRHYTFQYNQPRYVSRPSGHLTISIDTRQHFWGSSARRNWNGSDKRPIEGCLSSVVRGMEKLSAAFCAWVEDRERERRLEAERHRAAETARQEQERRQRAIAEEKARVDRLLEQTRRWQASQTLREFIRAAQRPEAASMLGFAGDELASWTAWANRQADALDPLARPPLPETAVDPNGTAG